MDTQEDGNDWILLTFLVLELESTISLFDSNIHAEVIIISSDASWIKVDAKNKILKVPIVDLRL